MFTAALALAGWLVGLAPIGDNSFLWHLRTGHLILDSGIPHSDPYSFTSAGNDWVAQSWLGEVAYGVIDDLAGPFGIRILAALLLATLFALMYRLALDSSQDRIRAALVSALCALPVSVIAGARPLMFGLVAMAGLVWIVEVPHSGAARHSRWVIPPLLWVWANTHGSWTLGGAYLALHLVGAWLDGSPPWLGRERRLVESGAIGFVLAFANPYVADLVLFPVRLMGRGDVLADVAEWQSTTLRSRNGIAYGLVVAVLFAGLARRRSSRRDTLVGVAFALAGWWAVRNIAIAAIVLLPLMGRAFSSAKSSPSADEPRVVHAAAVGFLAAVAVLGAFAGSREESLDFDTYPVAALEYIEAEGRLGERMFHTDEDGGYIILEYWPRQLVFYDDRFDMYPVDLQEDWQTIARVEDGWDDRLDDYAISLVLWPQDAPLVRALDLHPDWDEVYRDEDFAVIERAA